MLPRRLLWQHLHCLLLINACQGLALFGGVQRVGTLNINGDNVIAPTATATAAATTTTSSSTLSMSTPLGRTTPFIERVSISNGMPKQTPPTTSRKTYWADRGTYIDREERRSNNSIHNHPREQDNRQDQRHRAIPTQQRRDQHQRISRTNINLLDRPTTNTPLYCLNVCIRIKPERRAEFLRCIAANQHGTLTSEPLAVTYVYGEDVDETNTWYFFEQYIGNAGFEAHCQTYHFKEWETFASSNPFQMTPEVKFFIEDTTNIDSGVCHGSNVVRDAVMAYNSSSNNNNSGNDNNEKTTVKLFCLDVQLSIKPEKRLDFLEALRANQAGVIHSEWKAVSFIFGEDVTTFNVFHIFEAYVEGAFTYRAL